MSRSERERLALELMAEARAYARTENCSMKIALSEVAKSERELWWAYSQAVLGHEAKPKVAARVILMGEMNAYAKENNCSLGAALTEICKRDPDLWQAYSEQVMGLK